jgi:formate transporter
MANGLVCLAVWMAMAGRSVTDKILAIVLPVAAFVAAGFEHSIANMYFVPAGLFIKRWAPEAFWSANGIERAEYGGLSWSSFLIDNLVPVTIGNIIGGTILVGLVYWHVYRRAADVDDPAADGSRPRRRRSHPGAWSR